MKIHFDLLGMAMNDFMHGNKNAKIAVYSPDFEDDEIEVSWYFRKYEMMPEVEKAALQLCRGSILDVGAGAGSHALYLQESGKEVTAMDISGGACETMRNRGVKNVIQENINNYREKKYDSVLMLMNGIGIFGKIHSLDSFLDTLPQHLNPGGQLIFDSTNLIYLYQDRTGAADMALHGDYYGEIRFRLGYDEFFTDSFHWLYIDFDTISWMAGNKGLKAELIMEGENYHYLARLMF